MNVDEFLRDQETMSDLEIYDGDSYRGVSRKKLLALVRKLREQRDERPVYGGFDTPSQSEWVKWRDEDNVALDEIVREA